MTDEPRIRDIPSYKKALKDIRALKNLKRAAPVARPVLRLLGVDTAKIEEALHDVGELERRFEELASLPDRFNDLFGSRGWMIYDLMSVEVAKAAVDKAESGDFDAAEADLVEHHDPDTVAWKLRTMIAVKNFRPRIPLAERALVDYREGRYHACVPVVLALLDGMVTESHPRRRGFFAEDTDLEAWDSITAHAKGLIVLARTLNKGRRKTSTEQITIPYRHGIMHGMDLGYDNKMVAAKAWAALFAARDFAIKAEKGLLDPPPAEAETSWRDIVRQIQELNQDKERLKEWKPRSVRLDADVPSTGTADMLGDGTPEHRLAEWLSYWKTGNFGFMARCLSALSAPNAKAAAAHVRRACGQRQLLSFEFIEITDAAPAITEIETRLVWVEGGNKTEKAVRFRMINEDESGNACVRGKPGSAWTVLNWEAI